ncbi:ribosomal protein S18 acetylase RimI-like enzyme [Defluviimonas denitrificans]|jgi:GNAT superfamily N-acetyltransferase|uniref:Ribosomal protein S18 acetylase RimI-like enzyme n=1 Tax=Albidovulum denitrificans TaxID=404881 RepID=A0A2S8SD86_9RHOB|nr:GNAT family N-acetyltransferase [Defluviimonas denitrificans]PQV58817.1 ribosomal protein S18 acetylase RimI-like enzyme [Defluviimonas denitrificans]
MTPTIRDARAEDEAGWRRLWQAYLTFYDHPLPEETTAFTWARLMSPDSALNMRLAVNGPDILGFAIHQHHASTWVAGDDCYLEDLFVDEAQRGGGIGRALIDDLRALARAKGWKRLYWHTGRDNARARALYDSYTPEDGHVRYRMTL